MGGLSHTVSGDIASFRTPSRVPIESLKFHFLPKQAAGTPSPENPILIEGWTGLNGKRAGKNLLKFNKQLYLNPHTAGGITFTAYYNADGSLSHINVKGTKTGANVFYNLNYVAPGVPMKAGHYIVSGMISGKVEMQAFEYNPNETLILNTSRGIFDFEVHNGNTKSWIRLQVVTDEYIDEDVYPMLMAYPCSDTEYESYSEEQIPITFPVVGTNKLNPSDIRIHDNHFTLENGVYKNAVTDTRSTIQLAVQLWKTTGTYIKTLYVDYLTTIGRHSLTFTVDDPNGHYICLKHNGIKKDFILLFPWEFGLHQFTISLDILANDPTTVGGIQLTNIQLEPGDTAHAYEPYSSDNTFYGGYIDPVAGEIVAEWVKQIYDGSSDELWDKLNSGSASAFAMRILTPKRYNSENSFVCDSLLKIARSVTWGNYDKWISDNGGYIITGIQSITTVEDWKEFLSENPIVVVYKLKTPIHIPIPAQDLQAFLDHNNFWSDANDITEVTYAVTESKDMLATRKKAMDFDIGHHKKVKWNNMAGTMNSDYWQRYNELSTSVLYENGEATLTVERTSTQRYIVSLYTKNNPYVYEDHRYYMSYMILSSYDNAGFGAEFAKDIYVDFPNISSNVWTRFSAASKAGGTGMGRIYTPYFKNGTYQVGDYVKIKNVYYVDLTLMFGAGNEPTKAEFEHICEINGIDLTTYQPYDEGSDKWLIIP